MSPKNGLAWASERPQTDLLRQPGAIVLAGNRLKAQWGSNAVTRGPGMTPPAENQRQPEVSETVEKTGHAFEKSKSPRWPMTISSAVRSFAAARMKGGISHSILVAIRSFWAYCPVPLRPHRDQLRDLPHLTNRYHSNRTFVDTPIGSCAKPDLGRWPIDSFLGSKSDWARRNQTRSRNPFIATPNSR